MELERSCCREKRLMGLCVLFESLVVRLLELCGGETVGITCPQ